MEISEALKKVEDWIETADKLEEEIKEKGNEIVKENPYSPIWSNKLEDIPGFLTAIKEWLQDPILRRVKEYISTLKQIANDKRDFKHLPREYLLDIADILKNAMEKITYIERKPLKMNSTKYILDNLIQQREKSDIESALQAIENYYSALQEKIISFDCEESIFLETIKNDIINTVIQTTNFEEEEIERSFQSMEQAKKARNLLKNIVSENAFVKEYENTKNVDEIWNLANSINEILRQTKPREEEYEGEGKHPRHSLKIQ